MSYDYKGMAGNMDSSFIINHHAPLFCYKNFQVQTGNRVENFSIQQETLLLRLNVIMIM